MAISWFPGHMNKARKELGKIMSQANVLLDVRDARMPLASENPLIASSAGDAMHLVLLNKCDLIDDVSLAAWQAYFTRLTGSPCLTCSKDEAFGAESVIQLIRREITRRGLPVSRFRTLTIVVAGIPNVGKSTLMNKLADRKLARTGNEPAITRSQQRIRLADDCYLIDTPGLMKPRLEDQEAACLLAAAGTIRQTAIDLEEVAWHFAQWLIDKEPESLRARYGFSAPAASPGDSSTVESLFLSIARSRGALSGGGQPDWHKVANLLLNDFRSGKLGKLSLESPPHPPAAPAKGTCESD